MKHLLASEYSQVLPLNRCQYQVFCDFDGTLVNIASAPHKIYVNEYIPRLLSDLDEKCQFCIVSGRALKDLQNYLPISEFNVYGCHGAEFSPKGQGCDKDPCVNELLQSVELMLGDILFQYPGVMIEEKPYSIAIHYRSYSGDEQDLKRTLEGIVSSFPGQLKLLAGKKVFEFCLCNINKGVAVSDYINKQSKVSRKSSGVMTIFVGDDVTDEAGFKTINALNGISIRVGRIKDSAAQYYVDDIYEVHALLEYLSQSHSINSPVN